MSEPEPGTPRVRLLVRPGCHLCVEALAVIQRVCDELGEGFEEVEIDAHPDLVARYSDEVPVTFVDGRQHDFWRVDEGRLRAALEG